jgi:uncharacterized protein (DUF2147 family)
MLRLIRNNTVCIFAISLLVLVGAVAGRAQELSPKLQSAVGHWQVVNNDGTPGGKVDIYLENGKLFGKVTEVRPGRTPHDLCDKCSGEASKQLILGMVILRNFRSNGDDWVDGMVLDPENGKEYKGKVWAVGKDQLHMRGFVGISLLGRTATWTRIP